MGTKVTQKMRCDHNFVAVAMVSKVILNPATALMNNKNRST
jgi:hypothetical protein